MIASSILSKLAADCCLVATSSSVKSNTGVNWLLVESTKASVAASFIEEEVTSAGVEWSANRVKRLEVGPVENAPHLTARDRMKQTYAVVSAVMLDIDIDIVLLVLV
mmetsp:Transcript_6397/g.9383  ORF Transcript_6397/g.9383 Transcript_6397/m.9383 type:complete len:107 (-) Transcript_6397:3-323(-)